MRMRRCFQPMLDSMPYRIAPSAFGVATTPVTTSTTKDADMPRQAT